MGSWELTDVQLERAAGQPPPPRPPGRHSHVAGAFGDGVLVFGGAGLRGPLSDVWLFEPARRQWRCLSAALRQDEGPEAREMVRPWWPAGWSVAWPVQAHTQP